MLRLAYQDAGVDPRTVQYVEAHGTGTRAGDPVELGALGAVIGRDRSDRTPFLVGSVKTNLGHTEGAAGIAGLIKVALAFKNGAIPPSLHLNEFTPSIPWKQLNLTIPRELTTWQVTEETVAGVSAFGIVGTNAHMVLAGAPPSPVHQQPKKRSIPYLLPLSAHTPQALKALIESYQSMLDADTSLTLVDLCYSASRHRTHHSERLALVANSRQELLDQFTDYLQNQPNKSKSPNVAKTGEKSKVVFVFPGQGSQWLGMGRDLLVENPVFREVLLRCEEAMKPWVDWSLLKQLELSEDSPSYRLNEIGVIQPVLFAIEVALAAVWVSWGIEPSAVIGHSMGEVAAAYIAGALTLEDAACVICNRSQLMQRTSGNGAMAVVGLSFLEAEQVLKGHEHQLSIAVHNSPRSVVLSGDPSTLDTLMNQLTNQGIFCRSVKVDVASHSPQMEPLLPELVASLKDIQPKAGITPFYSTATGQVFDGSSLDAQYWKKNMRQPVRFQPMIEQLLREDFTVFIEMSPHPILLTAIEETGHQASKQISSVPSLLRGEPGSLQLMRSLGMLYEAGLSIQWEKLYPSGQLVKLPVYPWQRRRFWYEGAAVTTTHGQFAGNIDHPLLGYRLPDLAHAPDSHTWQNSFTKFRNSAQLKDAVLTAAPFSVMAMAAMNIIFGNKNHAIRKINVQKPSFQLDTAEGTIQTSLVEKGQEISFQVFYREDDASAWETFADAELQIGKVDSSWLYDLEWEKSDAASVGDDEKALTGIWLILADKEGIGASLAAKLNARGAATKLCPFEQDSVGFDQILADIENSLPLHIIDLWGLDLPHNGEITSDGLMQAQACGAEALLSLTQVLLRQQRSQTPGLWVVTRGAQSVSSEEPQLQSAAMWGLGRIISLEQPELWRGIIDLSSDDAKEAQVESLFNEISHPSTEDQVVYRNNQRYVPRLIPSQPTTEVLQPLQVSSDGTYLITGGLGTLGIQLGRWIVQRGAKNLVLTSRSGLPDRSEWNSIPADSHTGQRISNVRSLEKAGTQVHVVQADVADETAMGKLVDQFGESLPSLQGVIHAAGITTNQTIAELTLNDWREVLQPKVTGAWILHRLTAELPLDFFVCFSSAASVWGSQGMAHYAAANHFLDQLAHYRSAHQLPALTVNWGWWSGNGIATREQAELFSKVGMGEMPADNALAALQYLLEKGATQQIVADVDWIVFKPIYESKRERRMFSHIQTKKTAETVSSSSEEENNEFLEELRAATTEKQSELLVDLVRRTAAEILGFDTPRSLNTQQGFFKIGMDSLMTVQLRTRLEASLDCSLPPTIAFEYPTIAQMVSYLVKNVLQSQDRALDQDSEVQVDEPDLELDDISEDDLLKLLDSELTKADDITKDGK